MTSLTVPQSSTDVLKFWTPERIRQAKAHPLPVPTMTPAAEAKARLRSAALGKTTPTGTAVSADAIAPLAARKPAPQSAAATLTPSYATMSQSALAGPVMGWETSVVGKLFINDNGNLATCSATVIVSNSHNSIWTAGHCLNRGNGKGFYNSFAFAPDYDQGERWGYWTVQNVVVSSDWANSGDSLWGDMGGGKVVPSSTYGNLQDAIGAWGYQFNGGTDFSNATSLGYPVDGYNRPASDFASGEHRMYCQGSTVDAANFNPFDDRLQINCDMGHGASGGPIAINVGGNTQIVGTKRAECELMSVLSSPERVALPSTAGRGAGAVLR